MLIFCHEMAAAVPMTHLTRGPEAGNAEANWAV